MRRIFLSLTLFLPLAVVAQPEPIRLANRVIAPPPGVESALQERIRVSPEFPVHGIVQLFKFPTTDDRAKLAGNGIELSTFLGGSAYFASFGRTANLAESAATIRWAGPLLAQDKLEPGLWRGETEPWAQTPLGNVRVLVTFHTDVPPGHAERIRLKYANDWRYMEGHGAWATELEPKNLLQLVEEESVRWIEQGPRPEMLLSPQIERSPCN